MTLKVAAIQMCSTADMARNEIDFEALVRTAAKQGARYVQTPEMTGLVQKNPKALHAAIHDQDNDPIFKKAAALAKELAIHIHVGSTPIRRKDSKVANRAGLFGTQGQLLATYDKIHMFDVDLDNGESWRESAIYEPGSSLVLAEVSSVRLGFAICYDLRFPQLFHDQALKGAHVLTVPAAFTQQTGQAHWHALLRARAIENGCFVIAAAQGGAHEDGRQTYGHSLIVDPWGAVISEKADDQPGVIVADIDIAAVIAARGKIPNLQNARAYS